MFRANSQQCRSLSRSALTTSAFRSVSFISSEALEIFVRIIPRQKHSQTKEVFCPAYMPTPVPKGLPAPPLNVGSKHSEPRAVSLRHANNLGPKQTLPSPVTHASSRWHVILPQSVAMAQTFIQKKVSANTVTNSFLSKPLHFPSG